MTEYDRGTEVWVLGYNEPKLGVFQSQHIHGNNECHAVVLFHGQPEVVIWDDVYCSRQSCYAAAAAVEQRKAMVAMHRAAAYSEEAKKSD